MSANQAPSFTDLTLNMSERFQHATRNTKWAPKIIEKFTGSDAPSYEQLLWLPPQRRQTITNGKLLHVPGDDHAAKKARNWGNVAVLGASVLSYAEMDDLSNGSNVQAVAYRSSREWHVGVSATQQAFMHSIEGYAQAVAPRIGSGSVDFQIGVYIPEDKHFVGFSEVEVIEASLPEDELATRYPAVTIV